MIELGSHVPKQQMLTPFHKGDLYHKNWVVMATLTRMSAQPHDEISTKLQAMDGAS